MFSDLLQARMQTSIMHNVASATIPVVQSVTMIPSDVKQKVSDLLEEMGKQTDTDVQAATWYKPENSWNYELGTHLNLFNSRLQADLAAFLMDTRDQQVSKMSAGGLGRVTVNSGRSRSLGAEVSLRASLTDNLSAYANYGFTHAKFRDDDRDTFVPFVPRHTFSVGATQQWSVRGHWLDGIALHVDYSGAGRIYWTEANTVWQDFVGTLNGRLALHKKGTELSLYAHNILSTRFETFYFETMQRGFAQYSRPMEVGLQLRLRY
jgi:outer membrane receptor protein involved in Fe transport